jgi:hypothetical protein
VIKLDFDHGDSALIHAEITREQFETLSPALGERLYVKPRKVRIFVEPD